MFMLCYVRVGLSQSFVCNHHNQAPKYFTKQFKQVLLALLLTKDTVALINPKSIYQTFKSKNGFKIRNSIMREEKTLKKMQHKLEKKTH